MREGSMRGEGLVQIELSAEALGSLADTLRAVMPWTLYLDIWDALSEPWKAAAGGAARVALAMRPSEARTIILWLRAHRGAVASPRAELLEHVADDLTAACPTADSSISTLRTTIVSEYLESRL
jgi:hypothetical protein